MVLNRVRVLFGNNCLREDDCLSVCDISSQLRQVESPYLHLYMHF